MTPSNLLLISRDDIQKIVAFAARHGLSAELSALGIQVSEPEIVMESVLVDSDDKPLTADDECSLCHHECAACRADGTGTGRVEDCQCACG